ncbi:hypothetical protein EVAR_49719_1 [Eumeta japonica]|uniref:Uncharacterized protein n=1 Tax=Eumeta variegata TaxID=151549 RepID=A0A4C1Z235_EUMVA|nr:hypothetical protein EVAR_49719_1 [Eumeta japonica]
MYTSQPSDDYYTALTYQSRIIIPSNAQAHLSFGPRNLYDGRITFVTLEMRRTMASGGKGSEQCAQRERVRRSHRSGTFGEKKQSQRTVNRFTSSTRRIHEIIQTLLRSGRGVSLSARFVTVTGRRGVAGAAAATALLAAQRPGGAVVEWFCCVRGKC